MTKLSTIDPDKINIDHINKKSDQMKLKILAIINGQVNCSYHDAMQELDKYAVLVKLMNSDYLFLLQAKMLIAEHFGYPKDNGTTM